MVWMKFMKAEGQTWCTKEYIKGFTLFWEGFFVGCLVFLDHEFWKGSGFGSFFQATLTVSSLCGICMNRFINRDLRMGIFNYYFIKKKKSWQVQRRLSWNWYIFCFLLKCDPKTQVPLFYIAACEWVQCSEYIDYHGLWDVVHPLVYLLSGFWYWMINTPVLLLSSIICTHSQPDHLKYD